MPNRAFVEILEGVARFQREVFPQRRELFEQLSHKQQPEVLFLTCADSRVDPSLLTQSRPGQLFICRNIGNVVPPHGTADGGVATIMEYAVGLLGVKHVIVCGHSDCGAMKSLIDPAVDDGQIPQVMAWLRYAETAKRVVNAIHSEKIGKDRLQTVTEQNVIAQLNNLRTFPEVAAGLAAGKLQLHGWYYSIGTGDVTMYDQGKGGFVPLGNLAPNFVQGG